MDSGRLQARVTGRVQGVGFRAFTRDAARRLQLSGGVRNGDDGAVYVVAEGPCEKLDSLVASLRRGPAAGHVDGVEIVWGATEGLSGPFEVWR